MQGTTYAWVIERLVLRIDPDALDHALVERGSRKAGRRLGLARRDRIRNADVVAPARQYRRPELGRERDQIVKFDAIEIGQSLVPIIRVLLDNADLVFDITDTAERTSAGITGQLSEVVVVVLERFLADDHIPAAGDRQHNKALRARLRQFEFDRIGVLRVDLADRLEQDTARNADPGRRLGNAVERCLDVIGSQLRAVMELNPLAQEKRVGLAVPGNLPAVREIGNDRLAAVARIVPYQIVEHAAHGAESADRPRLVNVEMRRAHQNPIAQHAAAFWIWLGGFELKV